MSSFFLDSLLFSIPLISCGLISLINFVPNRPQIFNFVKILNIVSIFCSTVGLLLFMKYGVVSIFDIAIWFDTIFLEVDFSFKYGSLSRIMLWVVSIITTCVIMYSMSYMKKDPNRGRFLQYIFLFQWFMYILVLSSNFFVLIIGWEGIGLCSYLLIGFWSTRLSARKAAMKAMIVNSIGDVCLFMAMAVITYYFQTLDFEVLSQLVHFVPESDQPWIQFITGLLIVAVTSKSSQIGLHIWLSDAMEGPTPVSALIHAATMVTAGIYLVIRTSFLFEICPSALTFLTILGTLTAFVAATMALGQYDIKKIIAFSTCSQLGYMLSCCGLSAYNFGFFHLVTHAFFKALLFLCAGVIIHSLGGEQDIRKMGGLQKWMPLTYIAMLIATLALIGFPYTAGFYSKDLILETAYSNKFFEGNVMLVLETITAFLTSFYSFRLLHFVFLTKPNASRAKFNHFHEAPAEMAIPLITLSIFSLFAGYLLKDVFVGLGSDFFVDSISVLPERFRQIEAEFIWYWAWDRNFFTSINLKHIPVVASLSGFIFSYFFYRRMRLHTQEGLTFSIFNKNDLWKKNIFDFLSNKWYFDKVYLKVFALFIMNTSYNVGIKVWSASINWVEQGVVSFFVGGYDQLKLAHAGKLHNYIVYMIFMQALLMLLLIFINR